MPALENAKHERFAQALAKGKSATEAYVLAGYKDNDGNAATLKGNQRVADRVAEILERAATRVEVTVASITESLLRIAKKGEALEESAGLQVARASYMDAAKLNGLVVDQVKSENTNRTALISDKPLTEDEWADRASALH
jgi:phage terminase small subunit